METTRFTSLLGFVLGLSLTLSVAVAQNSQNANEGLGVDTKCIQRRIADGTGFFMMQHNTVLNVGFEMKAFRVVIVTEYPFAIVLFNQINGTQRYRMVWNQTFNSLEPSIVPKILQLATPRVLTEEDRLAIWTQETEEVPILFDFKVDPTFRYRLSTEKYTDPSEFTAGLEIELQDLPWPRSFLPYIEICSDKDCRDDSEAPVSPGLTPDEPIIPPRDDSGVGPKGPKGDKGDPGARGLQGPPGPPGPPGNLGSFEGFDDFNIACEVPQVTREVIATGSKVEELENAVEMMRETLNNIYNSNAVTGICPLNTMPGDYGLGSCYVIIGERLPMGVAQIRCREEYDGHLVRIDTPREERFLKNQINAISTTFQRDANGLVQFWTSGMYSFEFPAGWYWWDEPRRTTSIFQYQNWRPGTQIVVKKGSWDICLTLSIDPEATTSVWDIDGCSKFKYFICEVDKKCL